MGWARAGSQQECPGGTPARCALCPRAPCLARAPRESCRRQRPRPSGEGGCSEQARGRAGQRPPQAGAPGMQRRGPETLKQGRQSQRPAGNTCERASPRPSLAPGSSACRMRLAPRFGEDLPLEWLICYSSDSQSQRPAGNTCGRASCLAPLWPQAAVSSRSQPWCAGPRQSTKQEPSLPRPQHGGLGRA